MITKKIEDRSEELQKYFNDNLSTQEQSLI